MAKKNNIYFVIAALALATCCRNSLELIGLLTKSRNFCCFYFSASSFLNTFTYTLMLIFVGAFGVHVLLGGNRLQLRLLIWRATFFLLIVFIIVPLINLLFNYHGLLLPIWYHSRLLLSDFYLPAGCLAGFLLILLFFPSLIKRIYPGIPLYAVFMKLFSIFILMVLYAYQIGPWFAVKFIPAYVHFQKVDSLLDIYSATFLFPVLCFFPSFIRHYCEDEDKSRAKIVYAGFIVLQLLLAKGFLPAFLMRIFAILGPAFSIADHHIY